MWSRLTVLETLLVLTAMGAPDTVSEDAARAAPFLVAVGEPSLRCVGALVSVRGALTTRECGAVATEVRAPGGAAVAVRAVRAPRSGEVALLELADPVEGGRPILLAEESAQCESSCYVARTGRPSVVPAAPTQCEGGGAGCVRAEGLCSAEAGGAVVCGGRLCGVLARPHADCPDLHRLYSVPNWKQFLHCAHTLNTCGSEECMEICEETAAGQVGGDMSAVARGGVGGGGLMDVGGEEVVVRSKGKYESGREYRAVTKEEPEKEAGLDEGRGGEPEERPVMSMEPEERPPVVDVEPEERPAPVAKEEGPPAPGAPRGVVFEPGRADFRSGEYGDTAVEYEDVEPRAPPSIKTAGLTAPPRSTVRPPPPQPPSSQPPPPPQRNTSISLSRRRAVEMPNTTVSTTQAPQQFERSHSYVKKLSKTFVIGLLLIQTFFM